MRIRRIYDLYLQLTIRGLEILGVSAFGQYNIYHRHQHLLNVVRHRNPRTKDRELLPDGLPIPPPQLIFLVAGGYDKETFYSGGAEGAECIKAVLKKNGLDINKFESILDFGCGCGRILRHWKTLSGPKIFGTDYNPPLVKWCQKSLPFAEIKQNMPAAKLDYENDKFDFIYVISVFTHLSEKLQDFWIDELTRVLKPGGYLLITVHGTTRFHQLWPEALHEYEAGQLVVIKPENSGTNLCATFHPEAYMREWLCQKLTIVDFVPGGAKDADQDIFLLQKPKKDNRKAAQTERKK